MKKIILIEDEPYINELYKITLESAGYNVISVFDGEQGFQAVQQNTDAGIVLLDIMLPKMHGLDVLKKIKSNAETKNMTVVILSNLGDESIVEKAHEYGARDFLIKATIEPKQLVACVTNYLIDPNYIYADAQ